MARECNGMTITQDQIERWRAQGHSDVLISRWIANAERARHEANTLAAGIEKLYARMVGKAPGTAFADVVVIDQAPVACPACGGTKWILSAGGTLTPCELCGADREIAQARADSLVKYSSANGRATAQTFGNFQATPHTALMVDRCRAWAEKPAGWLVLWGNPGNGKSHLCAAVYNVLRNSRQPAIFISGPDLMTSLKALMDDEVAEAEGETVAQREEKYQRAPVLILDDVRAEQQTAWSDAVWFRILDHRYRNRMPTMIATNENPAGPDFPGRLSSRLRDEHDGFSLVLHNTAPDYRVHG
jgi:DNA replication protein DnaC